MTARGRRKGRKLGGEKGKRGIVTSLHAGYKRKGRREREEGGRKTEGKGGEGGETRAANGVLLLHLLSPFHILMKMIEGEGKKKKGRCRKRKPILHSDKGKRSSGEKGKREKPSAIGSSFSSSLFPDQWPTLR